VAFSCRSAAWFTSARTRSVTPDTVSADLPACTFAASASFVTVSACLGCELFWLKAILRLRPFKPMLTDLHLSEIVRHNGGGKHQSCCSAKVDSYAFGARNIFDIICPAG
jgi:hypothetical protein